MEVAPRQSTYVVIMKKITEFIWKYLVAFVKLFELIVARIGSIIRNQMERNVQNVQNGHKGITETKLKSLKQIPGPTSFPFFGTMLSSGSIMTAEDLNAATDESYRRFGPIVKEESVFNIPVIMVYELTNDVDTVSRSMDRPPMPILNMYRKFKKSEYESVGITCSLGTEWASLRKTFVTPILGKFDFTQYLGEVNCIADEFVESLRKLPTTIPNFNDYVNKVVVECGGYLISNERLGFFNVDRPTAPKQQRFLAMHDKYWRAVHESMYGYPWWAMFPTKTWTSFAEAEDCMHSFIIEMIENYQHNGSSAILNRIMEQTDFSFKDRAVMVHEVFLGSVEPVFTTTLLFIFMLAKNQQVQEKLHAELVSALPTLDSPIDSEMVENLSYLQACIKETFRLSSTAPNLARVMENDTNILGYMIPTNTIMVYQWAVVARQEKNFYRAKEFLPERWIPVGIEPPFQPHNTKCIRTFGIGKRVCPGRHVARKTLAVLIAKMFRNFHVLCSNDISIKYECLITPSFPFGVTLTPYEK